MQRVALFCFVKWAQGTCRTHWRHQQRRGKRLAGSLRVTWAQVGGCYTGTLPVSCANLALLVGSSWSIADAPPDEYYQYTVEQVKTQPNSEVLLAGLEAK